MMKTFFQVLLMLVWVGAAVIVSQLVVGNLMLCFMDVKTFTLPVWSAVYSALSYILALLLVILIPAKFLKKVKPEAKNGVFWPTNRNELGLKGSPTWVDIGLAPIGFIVSLILAGGLTALFNVFPWFNAEEVQELSFSVYVAGFDRIIAFLILVVVAPVAEELIFRGWLYGRLRSKLLKRMPEAASMLLSIFLVSLLFGVVHMQWNVGVSVFALSVVLCGLREITGTIYAGILTHMIKNGVAFYLLYVLGV